MLMVEAAADRSRAQPAVFHPGREVARNHLRDARTLSGRPCTGTIWRVEPVTVVGARNAENESASE